MRSAILVYLQLGTGADDYHPSVRLIAEELGMDKTTVSRCLRLLEKYNMIQVVRKGCWSGAIGNNENSIYSFTDPKDWKFPSVPLAPCPQPGTPTVNQGAGPPAPVSDESRDSGPNSKFDELPTGSPRNHGDRIASPPVGDRCEDDVRTAQVRVAESCGHYNNLLKDPQELRNTIKDSSKFTLEGSEPPQEDVVQRDEFDQGEHSSPKEKFTHSLNSSEDVREREADLGVSRGGIPSPLESPKEEAPPPPIRVASEVSDFQVDQQIEIDLFDSDAVNQDAVARAKLLSEDGCHKKANQLVFLGERYGGAPAESWISEREDEERQDSSEEKDFADEVNRQLFGNLRFLRDFRWTDRSIVTPAMLGRAIALAARDFTVTLPNGSEQFRDVLEHSFMKNFEVFFCADRSEYIKEAFRGIEQGYKERPRCPPANDLELIAYYLGKKVEELA